MIDFTNMIDNHIRRDPRPKSIGRYYPSEIGLCLRKTWYSYKFPTETPPELLRIFEIGNIMHEFVVNVFKSDKNPDVELIKSEFPLRFGGDDFIVSGRVDNLILVKTENKEVLVEVKSSGDVDHINEAAHHNKMQLQLYMHITGIHNGILLYVDKRNLQSKVFTVEYDSEEAERIVRRFSELHKNLRSGILPLPEARASSQEVWQCKFCEFRERCYVATPSSSKWL